MRKLTMLVAGAAGYVLGSKAGRERYEQIKAGASKVAQDPRVRSKAKDAGTMVQDKAPVLKDKVTGAAASTKDAVKDKTSSSSDTAPVTGMDPAPVTGMGPAPVTGTDPSTTSPYPAS